MRQTGRHARLFGPLLVVLIAVLARIHYSWIFSGAPLVSGDWPYFHIGHLVQWFPFHPLWITYDSLGRTISQGNFVLLFSVYGWLAKAGANFELISRLLFFLPVLVLAPLSSFLAVKELTRDKIAALAGALVYSCNTYFIVIQAGHMHLSMTYALAPFAYYFAGREHPRSNVWLFVTLALMSIYDVRMTIVVGLLAGIMVLFHKVQTRADFVRTARSMTLGGVAVLLFNCFWLLPAAFTEPGPFSHNYFAQDALNWVNQLDAFTLHHPFWSEGGVTDFVFQPASFYAFLLPIFAFLPFVLPSVRQKRELLFYGSITLVSMLLLMQENSLLGEPYRFVYEQVPMMSMFRESTKLFFVTGFGFSVLVGYLLTELRKGKQKRLAGVVLAGLLLVMLLPIRPYLTGQYVKTYKKEPISRDMDAINAAVTPAGEDFYRNLWVSRVPKFARASADRPSIDALVLGNFWGRHADPFDALGYLREPNLNGLLNFAGVKHVIVPSDHIDTNYKHYNFQASSYYRDIIERSGLKKTAEIGGTTVWKNEHPKPKLYFSTNTTLADAVSVFSGIDDSPTTAYLFKDQNQQPGQADLLKTAANNVELNPFKAEALRIDPGRATSTLDIPEGKAFDLYQKSDPAKDRTFSIIPGFDTSQPIVWPSPKLSGKNLYKNGSFEEDKPTVVYDAHNYDGTPLRHNGITGRVVPDATDGQKGFEITARRHIADISQKIPDFDKNASYLIALDYKYVSGPAPQIAFYPFDEEPFNRRINLPIDQPGKWTPYQTIIKPGHFSDELFFMIYVPTTDEKDSRLIVDNLRIYKLPAIPTAYLRTKEPALEPLTYRTLSSSVTKHRLAVSNLNEPRLLVLSETFDPGWTLTIKQAGTGGQNWLARHLPGIPTGYAVEPKQHLIANGFANSWWLDPHTLPDDVRTSAGTYELTLEYQPQRWFYVGSTISGAVVSGLIGYSVYVGIRAYRQRGKKQWR